MKQLHPGARWLFRIRGYLGAIFLVLFLSWFIIPFLVVVFKFFLGASAGSLFAIGAIIALIYLFLVIIIAEVYANMSYNRWFYEFTPNNLKIEKGIIWKKYSNIPYERVQNVDVTRGIIARIFGFSSVNMQTAGYSFVARGIPQSEGYIPAVSIDEAEKIREFLMKKISKNSGL